MVLRVDSHDLSLVKKILRRYLPHQEVLAFGSRVHGENLKPFSDLDLIVMNDEPLDPLCLAQLRDAFSESPLPFKVDILEWVSISPDFQRRIKEQSVTILKSEAGSANGQKREAGTS